MDHQQDMAVVIMEDTGDTRGITTGHSTVQADKVTEAQKFVPLADKWFVQEHILVHTAIPG
jgi:hypothetical protein